MGLDMYAYATSEPITAEADFKPDWERATLIHEWRKHPNLHGWMEQLYRAKDGQADEFNVVALMLTEADLDELEADVDSGVLPETTGFFFGASDGCEQADDLAFVHTAHAAIASGATVFYHSWW